MGLIRNILYLSFCERYLTDLRQGLADVDLQPQLLVSDRWAADCTVYLTSLFMNPFAILCSPVNRLIPQLKTPN
jgi:hypothetical protein